MPPRHRGPVLTFGAARSNKKSKSSNFFDDRSRLAADEAKRVRLEEEREALAQQKRDEEAALARRKEVALPEMAVEIGHSDACRLLIRHVTGDERASIVVVSGAVGSGKTTVAVGCLESCGFKAVVFSGIDSENGEEMAKQVENARKVKVAKGMVVEIEHSYRNASTGAYDVDCRSGEVKQPALLLDDFESFTPDTRRRVMASLKRTNAKGACPVVITCVQQRHPDMRLICNEVGVRLATPSRGVCVRVLAHRYPLHLVNATMDDLFPSRDLRSLTNELSLRVIDHNAGLSKTTFFQRPIATSNFDASRLLLERKVSASEWSTMCTEWDVDLIREFLAEGMNTEEDIHSLSHAYDTFSAVEASKPQRYELHSVLYPFIMYTAAQTTLCHSKTSHVGVLRPRRRTANLPDALPHLSETSMCERPMGRSEWLDVPTMLRQRVSARNVM